MAEGNGNPDTPAPGDIHAEAARQAGEAADAAEAAADALAAERQRAAAAAAAAASAAAAAAAAATTNNDAQRPPNVAPLVPPSTTTPATTQSAPPAPIDGASALLRPPAPPRIAANIRQDGAYQGDPRFAVDNAGTAHLYVGRDGRTLADIAADEALARQLERDLNTTDVEFTDADAHRRAQDPTAAAFDAAYAAQQARNAAALNARLAAETGAVPRVPQPGSDRAATFTTAAPQYTMPPDFNAGYRRQQTGLGNNVAPPVVPPLPPAAWQRNQTMPPPPPLAPPRRVNADSRQLPATGFPGVYTAAAAADPFARVTYSARNVFHASTDGAGAPHGSTTRPAQLPPPPPALPQLVQPQDVLAGIGITGLHNVMQDILFSGEEKPGEKEFPLKDFVQAVENRRAKHGWTDIQTVTHAASCFRGTAYEWFEHDFKTCLHPDQFAQATTNWAIFRQILITRFDLKNTMKLSLGAKTGLRPKERTETDIQYLHRIALARSANQLRTINSINFRDPQDYAPPPEAVALVHSNPEAALRLAAQHGFALGTELSNDTTMEGLVAEGFSSLKLREWAAKHVAVLPWWEFSQGIYKEEARLRSLQATDAHEHTQPRNKNNFRNFVSAVENMVALTDDDPDADPVELLQNDLGDDLDEEALQMAVAAIKRARAPRTNKRQTTKPRKPRNGEKKARTAAAAATAKPNNGRAEITCTFCHKPGHTADKCFRKEAFDQGREAAAKGQHF